MGETDLISRQWLMECVNEGWIKFDTEKDENRFIHLVRDIAPSVQGRKRVVWCRDCKKYELSKDGMSGQCRRQSATFYAYDYCSYGERKDG